MRILIVEDDIAVASDLESIARETGHQVVGLARDEKHAMELAKDAEIALVDVCLADGITGPDVARKLVNGFGVAVMFVSGNPDRVTIDDGISVGTVSKPYERAKVAAAIGLAAAWRRTHPFRKPPHPATHGL
jgi:DNA-binding response OmpR family regulator